MTKRPAAPVVTEAQELKACLDLLKHARQIIAWAERMNTGAFQPTDIKGLKRYVKFGFPGCPDILGQARDGRLFAWEVKRHGGRLTPAQDIMGRIIRLNGGYAGHGTAADLERYLKVVAAAVAEEQEDDR